MKNPSQNRSDLEIGSRKPENGDRKPGSGDRSPENGIGIWKMETGIRKMEIGDWYPDPGSAMGGQYPETVEAYLAGKPGEGLGPIY